MLAVDVSNWLSPDAATSPDRLLRHTYARGKGAAQMIPGWPYSVVATLESGRTSWTSDYVSRTVRMRSRKAKSVSGSTPHGSVKDGPGSRGWEPARACARIRGVRGVAAGAEPIGYDTMVPVTDHAEYAFTRLHHVQLAIPSGSENRCRAFWSGVLGLAELSKPAALAARGGCWFGGGGVEVHLGVESDFVPARKAHPGILVTGLAELAGRLTAAGVEVRWDDNFPGHARFYADDPFGNRLEFLEPAAEQ